MAVLAVLAVVAVVAVVAASSSPVTGGGTQAPDQRATQTLAG